MCLQSELFLAFVRWICEVGAVKLKVCDALPFGRENAIPAKVLAEALDAATGQESIERWYE